MLSPRKVATITTPGRHADGGGLYLAVDPSGAKRWVFLFRWKDQPGSAGSGRLREMGLGPLNAVTLAEAREEAGRSRALKQKGVDPIAARKANSAIPTFGAVADQVIAMKEAELRSSKTLARWKLALGAYAEPLRSLRVDAIETAGVLDVLKPIWSTKPEMAQKVRGYLEAVLDAAKAKGLRSGENPARWRGHLDQLLPKRQQLSRGHHAAVPFAEVPAFIAALRERDAVAGWALEFLVLTAARTGEVREARWSEIDLEARVWTIPAERMKAGREHRIPLSAPALAILDKAAKIPGDGIFVFPGQRPGKALSSGAMERVLDRMGVSATVHGFRSSFRDWAGEATNFPRELAEAALAHVVGDQTERAYRRGDALEKRRAMLDAWARYCEASPAGNVVTLDAAAALR